MQNYHELLLEGKVKIFWLRVWPHHAQRSFQVSLSTLNFERKIGTLKILGKGSRKHASSMLASHSQACLGIFHSRSNILKYIIKPVISGYIAVSILQACLMLRIYYATDSCFFPLK